MAEFKLEELKILEEVENTIIKEIDEELKPMYEEIKKINNSIWMRIHRSILWFIFPWTSFIKKAKMKEIEKIKEANRELLEKREEAENRRVNVLRLKLEAQGIDWKRKA